MVPLFVFSESFRNYSGLHISFNGSHLCEETYHPYYKGMCPFVSSFYVITKIDAVFLMINGSTLGLCYQSHFFQYALTSSVLLFFFFWQSDIKHKSTLLKKLKENVGHGQFCLKKRIQSLQFLREHSQNEPSWRFLCETWLQAEEACVCVPVADDVRG